MIGRVGVGNHVRPIQIYLRQLLDPSQRRLLISRYPIAMTLRGCPPRGLPIGGRGATAHRSLADQLRGHLPKPFGRLGIDRVRGDSGAGTRLVESSLLAVFEVTPADPLDLR